jgi:hypothetical protein
VLGWMGMVLAVYGSGWGVVAAIVGGESVWVYSLRGTGALALAMGAFGRGYYLTDTGAVLEACSVRMGFGLLFSLGALALGVGLLAAGARRAQRPRARC